MPAAYDPRFPYINELSRPVIGLEAEFEVFADDVQVTPEEYWKTPRAFVEGRPVKRTNKSLQLPAGGALYFDGGVIEVATPPIELGPGCTARAVRNLWQQIGYLREQLDRWERRAGHRVRLRGFSCHCNVSFEIPREERSRDRTIQKLALLLANVLPVPVIVAGANRRSSGVGVRPRRERVEITLDFVPDPARMAATIALIAGIVREVIGWPSYRLDQLDQRGIALPANVAPGKHAMRNGWVTRNYHFPTDPFACGIDDPCWMTNSGRRKSLRLMAREIATPFRESIRGLADAFSVQLLFAILRGSEPSLLELADRPPAYEDAGREPLPPSLQAAGTSAYEQVFIDLGHRKPVTIGGERLTPVAVKGWYHAVFRDGQGQERLLSIDQLLALTKPELAQPVTQRVSL